jgi:hypothetical protein
MTLGVFVLLSLAAYRVTRLITTDDLTRGFRAWVLARFPARVVPMTNPVNGSPIDGSATTSARWPVVLVNCSWCMGIWVTLVGVGLLHWRGYVHSWLITALAWLGSATVVGLLQRVEGL